MSVMLPANLVFVLNLVGFNWPAADEDKLKESAGHWREYASELHYVIADSNRILDQIRAENHGESIDALEQHWLQFGEHLREAHQAAGVVAEVLDGFALVVEGLKAAVLVQLGILAAELAATTGAALLTFGAAEAAAPEEIVVSQGIMRWLSREAIQKAERLVAEKITKTVTEKFLSIKNGLKALKASRTALLDFGKSVVRRGGKDLEHSTESAPALPRATLGWTESADYRATFEAANPAVREVWVHHAVEQQILTRYPGLVAKQEIHSLENLRGLPVGRINNEIHLSEIRTMWNDFYETHASPSRADILNFATEIDRKLGVFFTPRIS
jgi:hypothetical protein